MVSYASRQGMALIAVLIFLEIFSLTGLFALQRNIWESKLTTRFQFQSTLAAAANAKLKQIERQLNNFLPACSIPETPAPLLASKSPVWWRSVSCAGIFRMFQYYYVVEFLGTDPCAYIAGIDNDSDRSAGYYRVTLLMMPVKDPGQTVLRQSSIVKPVIPAAICTGSRHAVLPGRQMWRELI